MMYAAIMYKSIKRQLEANELFEAYVSNEYQADIYCKPCDKAKGETRV